MTALLALLATGCGRDAADDALVRQAESNRVAREECRLQGKELALEAARLMQETARERRQHPGSPRVSKLEAQQRALSEQIIRHQQQARALAKEAKELENLKKGNN